MLLADLYLLASQTDNNGFWEAFKQFLPVILIGFLILFIMFRYQSKKNTARQKLLNSIASGDKIITIGGIFGTVASVKENSFFLKVSDNVNIEMTRDAVYVILNKNEKNIQ